MGHFALAVMAVLAWFAASNTGFVPPDALSDRLWLVGLFPAVYLLGLTLIGD
jgi:hypothetical protein